MKTWTMAAALVLPMAAAAWDGENRYGPGVHADRYGRAFTYQTDQGQAVAPGTRVKPDGYGLGVGQDQYGRAVRAQGMDGRPLDPLAVPGDRR